MLRNAIKFCSSNIRHLFLNIACLASILAKSTGSRDFEEVFAERKLTQISDHALGGTVTRQISHTTCSTTLRALMWELF